MRKLSSILFVFVKFLQRPWWRRTFLSGQMIRSTIIQCSRILFFLLHHFEMHQQIHVKPTFFPPVMISRSTEKRFEIRFGLSKKFIISRRQIWMWQQKHATKQRTNIVSDLYLFSNQNKREFKSKVHSLYAILSLELIKKACRREKKNRLQK